MTLGSQKFARDTEVRSSEVNSHSASGCRANFREIRTTGSEVWCGRRDRHPRSDGLIHRYVNMISSLCFLTKH